MAADPNAVSTPVLWGWLITGLLWGGTILWNYLNRIHSNALADKIRDQNFELSEWAALRQEIKEALTTFESVIRELQYAEAETLTELKKYVKARHLGLIIAYEGLSQSLINADSSSYVEGNEWEHLCFGEDIEGESSWDRLMAIGADMQNCKKKVIAAQILAHARPNAKIICDAIRAAERLETIRHDPQTQRNNGNS